MTPISVSIREICHKLQKEISATSLYGEENKITASKEVGETMYGVVLWSDRNKDCAVIWCEDHASLAFFRNDSASTANGYEFGPGDLVEFEVREENDLRLALSPSVVAQGEYPGLADRLIRAGQSAQKSGREPTGLPGQERGASHVLPFPDVFDRSGAANLRHKTSGRRVG